MAQDIKQLFDVYIYECQYIRRLRPETIRGYTESFRQFTKLMPEISRPQDIDNELTIEFFKRIQNRQRIVGTVLKSGVKDSTVKTYWSKLNSFFEWLRRKRYIDDNPLQYLRLPQPLYEDQKALKDEEVHKIITAITLHPKTSLHLKRDMAMICCLLFCGVRFGEFVNLKVMDVDLEKGLLTVQGVTSKSKRTRYLPIHLTLRLHLIEYFKERNKKRYTTEYLFVSGNTDTGLSRMGVRHWVKRLNQLSGVKFHLHCFRHTFACNLAKCDVGQAKIQKLMGHSDIKMTMVYLRSISTDDLRDDVAKLSI